MEKTEEAKGRKSRKEREGSVLLWVEVCYVSVRSQGPVYYSPLESCGASNCPRGGTTC